jgi:diguanylate cyclase (GGDEF)-like protein
LSEFNRRLIWIFILTAIYFLGGKFGLTLAVVHPNATAVSPSLGIALGALLILGYGVWPGILLGAFLVNLTTSGTVATSLAIATGNTLEALTGAFLVFRYAGGQNAMKRSPDIFKFVILGGMVSSTIAATIGVWALVWSGSALPHDALPIWRTWWLGDAVSVIIVAPLLLLWNSNPFVRWRMAAIVEGAALFLCLIAIGLIVFGDALGTRTSDYPLEFLCVPFLIWAASRFGQREAALATLVLSVPAIWGTLHGLGHFAQLPKTESLLLLQAYLGVGAVMTLGLASEVADRRRAERDARILAGMDRLTGLGNYRKLIDTLESEIRRAERTERTFVFVLMDLDGLKKINDVYGHPIGNRALCRLANTLQVHCRSIDTAARYGGDEFALILPECGMEFARAITDRLSECLASDGELPELSLSIGYSVWPYNGRTVEELIQEADQALYEMKHLHYRNGTLSR